MVRSQASYFGVLIIHRKGVPDLRQSFPAIDSTNSRFRAAILPAVKFVYEEVLVYLPKSPISFNNRFGRNK